MALPREKSNFPGYLKKKIYIDIYIFFFPHEPFLKPLFDTIFLLFDVLFFLIGLMWALAPLSGIELTPLHWKVKF